MCISFFVACSSWLLLWQRNWKFPSFLFSFWLGIGVCSLKLWVRRWRNLASAAPDSPSLLSLAILMRAHKSGRSSRRIAERRRNNFSTPVSLFLYGELLEKKERKKKNDCIVGQSCRSRLLGQSFRRIFFERKKLRKERRRKFFLLRFVFWCVGCFGGVSPAVCVCLVCGPAVERLGLNLNLIPKLLDNLKKKNKIK